tara:strand:- start:305 stop:550 length:246 start_codon:yes stop_codon:yes gene_type:complete
MFDVAYAMTIQSKAVITAYLQNFIERLNLILFTLLLSPQFLVTYNAEFVEQKHRNKVIMTHIKLRNVRPNIAEASSSYTIF